MNIPNDTGYPWRTTKFVEYQKLAPPVDLITYIHYLDKRVASVDEALGLFWYHSVTYCDVSAIVLSENYPLLAGKITPSEVQNLWVTHKKDIPFCSARRYAKNMDWFVPLISQYMKSTHNCRPYKWVKSVCTSPNPIENYRRMEKELSSWKYMGRFSIGLFLEGCVILDKMFGVFNIEQPTLNNDWDKYANLTSGVLNLMYLDDAADMFDSMKKVKYAKINMAQLDKELSKTIEACKKQPIPVYADLIPDMSVISKLCSFRNLFKGARYGGYHHDRQLENLLFVVNNLSWGIPCCNWIMQARQELFPAHMLGEVYGWDGIRPERKKLWLEKGLTGVEKCSY